MVSGSSLINANKNPCRQTELLPAGTSSENSELLTSAELYSGNGATAFPDHPENILAEEFPTSHTTENPSNLDNLEGPGHEIQLQAAWSATSRNLYSLYSAVNNMGTLTVAPLPGASSEGLQPGSGRPLVISSLQETLVRLYDQATAACSNRNSRSVTGQVDVTFWWKHSGNSGIALPVTYRGPVSQVLKSYSTGIVTIGDLEKAGITGILQDHTSPLLTHR